MYGLGIFAQRNERNAVGWAFMPTVMDESILGWVFNPPQNHKVLIVDISGNLKCD
ncbi:MAG: hypothetical protein J6M43_02320 [Neisseriaceae bacterium]|nr:hypothetical protein [Neisseriaceae bacterium]